MTLPLRTPVSLRHRLTAAGIKIRSSQMTPRGRVMWWQGRHSLGAQDLAKLTGLVCFPGQADSVWLSPEDDAVVMDQRKA